MPVACGFTRDHPGTTHHDTVAQVVICSRRHYAARAAASAERRRVDWAAIGRIPVGKHDKGRYALRGDDGVVKFYLVSRSDTDWTSVEVLAGPQRHEIPKPAQTTILERIAADPTAAAELYADEKEECSQCGTGRTHRDSLARKMGPDCAKEFRRKMGGA